MDEHGLKEDIFKILRVLSSNDSFTQRDLSSHLGFSLGKTNYLLNSLIRKNLVKIRNFSRRKNKLKKVKYILTRKGFETKLHLTYHFLKRKESEYNHLKSEWDQLNAYAEALEE
ncbi:MAG: MarR family EPS-associated transcriptional regulator [Candidatus Omnitrophota bacterium]|nr:MAG: MarR family EPS-associated transcriptional regulator [Candidatus Omnitrophota bacterium]